MKIIVIGAGAWGTALAISASQNPLTRHTVTLWGRDPAQVQAMQSQRFNARYLPGMPLPDSLQVIDGPVQVLAGLVQGHELVIVATPMAGLRGVLQQIRDFKQPVAWLCKGFEPAASGTGGLLAHEIQTQIAPDLIAGVLSGPSFAQEVARGQPTALVAASAHSQVRETLVAAFHSPTLRVYANDDIVGVAMASTFLTAPPTSTPTISSLA